MPKAWREFIGLLKNKGETNSLAVTWRDAKCYLIGMIYDVIRRKIRTKNISNNKIRKNKEAKFED